MHRNDETRALATMPASVPTRATGTPAHAQPPAVQLLLAHSPRIVQPSAAALALAPRDAVLLAWLALEGPTPRTRLAQLLWPDSEPEAARNALRQRLFQLRKQAGDGL